MGEGGDGLLLAQIALGGVCGLLLRRSRLGELRAPAAQIALFGVYELLLRRSRLVS